MEPFGLFQFLQDLLSPTPKNSTEQTAPQPSVSQPAEKEKQDGFSQPKTDFSTSQNEAVLQFFSEHDKRIKQIKKRQ